MDGRVGRRTAGIVLLAAVAMSGCGDRPGEAGAIEPASDRGTGVASAPSDTGGGAVGAGAPTAANAGRSPAGRSSQGSSKEPVLAYYSSLARHDTAGARQRLSPEYLAQFGGTDAFARWAGNYTSLTGVLLGEVRTPDGEIAQQHPAYGELAQWPVTYTAALKTPSANEVDGSMDKFVLVGRAGAGGSWLILDITTSP
jgi:hypothetical protein